MPSYSFSNSDIHGRPFRGPCRWFRRRCGSAEPATIGDWAAPDLTSEDPIKEPQIPITHCGRQGCDRCIGPQQLLAHPADPKLMEVGQETALRMFLEQMGQPTGTEGGMLGNVGERDRFGVMGLD